VPAEHQIRGLGAIVLNVHDRTQTARVLTGVKNMRQLRDYAAPDANAQIHVFAMGQANGETSPAAELRVIEGKDLPPARQAPAARATSRSAHRTRRTPGRLRNPATNRTQRSRYRKKGNTHTKKKGNTHKRNTHNSDGDGFSSGHQLFPNARSIKVTSRIAAP
jgi:hypothetical protein